MKKTTTQTTNKDFIDKLEGLVLILIHNFTIQNHVFILKVIRLYLSKYDVADEVNHIIISNRLDDLYKEHKLYDEVDNVDTYLIIEKLINIVYDLYTLKELS